MEKDNNHNNSHNNSNHNNVQAVQIEFFTKKAKGERKKERIDNRVKQKKMCLNRKQKIHMCTFWQNVQ